MAVQTRAIKRRIKSVKNTRKITKAMELVAASKMRRSVSAVAHSRPLCKAGLEYGSVDWNAYGHDFASVACGPNKEATSVLLLLITSDRGLAGGFNTNILRRRTRENDQVAW